MAISEMKIQMVIDNYFNSECDTNTSIRQAFEKGFRIGVEKGESMNSPQKWISGEEWLPEEGVDVLVCLTDFETGRKEICVTRLNDYNFWRWHGRYNESCVAWMPLPDPYKGERKDDDKSCDTCKHHDKGWDDIVCDGCTKAHSNWERRDDD